MARPVNANPEENRQRLLDVAIGLFASQGFHGVSVRELAEAAKINVALVSYYYGGKDGLYDATVDEVYRRIASSVGPALVGGAELSLAALMERIYVAARAERDGVRLLLRQVLDHGRLTARTESKHFLPSLESAAQIAGELLRCSPAQARDAAVSLSYLVTRYVIQDHASLKAAFGVRTTDEAHARVVATLTAAAEGLVAAEHAHAPRAVAKNAKSSTRHKHDKE